MNGDKSLSNLSHCSPLPITSKGRSIIPSVSRNIVRKMYAEFSTNRPTSSAPNQLIMKSRNMKKIDKDRALMPPPPPPPRSPPPIKVISVVKSMGKKSLPKNYESQNHSANETPRIEYTVSSNWQELKEALACNDTLKTKSVTFKTWNVNLSHSGKIVIIERLKSGTWVTSNHTIMKRLSPTRLLTSFNYEYRLVGDICDKERSLPMYVHWKFCNGFPVDWKNVCQIWQSYVTSGSSPLFRWPLRPMAPNNDASNNCFKETPRPVSMDNGLNVLCGKVVPRKVKRRRKSSRSCSENSDSSSEEDKIPVYQQKRLPLNLNLFWNRIPGRKNEDVVKEGDFSLGREFESGSRILQYTR